ncbi:F-box domain containing protein [Pandoravirus salinus]|uniref:F-box domain containing protein n=1 Tax=Pandoravirus salinus TaxID=1349410 RepID=S4W4E7_9VIRU|nr:F-box domain [Pandoravirus salinus]AGO85582.1 F-box domain containing protein [Pandoravirus salinus]
MDPPQHFDALPDELLAAVAANLDAVSLAKAACACRTLARICMDPRPWRALCTTLGILRAPLYAPVVRGEVAVTSDPDDRWRWLCVLAVAGDDRRFPWHGGTLGGSRQRAPDLSAFQTGRVHGWFDAMGRIQGFGVETVDHLSPPADDTGWYAGTWENGLWHGHGVRRTHYMTTKCQWRRGMAHGHGESVDTPGRCFYVGAWKGGARHGHGTATCRIAGIECAGMWAAGRGRGWCVFSKLDGWRTGAGPCFRCDFVWWPAIDWEVFGDPRVRSVGLWCRNGKDTGKRTRIEYVDGSAFETPCRAPLTPYAAMPTGRGTLALANGTRLGCAMWHSGHPTETVTRTRPGSPLACAESWSEWKFYGCDIIACVDRTLALVGRDTAILCRRAVYETSYIDLLDSSNMEDADDPVAGLPWSAGRGSLADGIYYPKPIQAPDDFVRFVRLLAARLLPWTDAMVDYALSPTGPLANDAGPFFARALKDPIPHPLLTSTCAPGPDRVVCRLTGVCVRVAECVITIGGHLMWNCAAKAWLRTLGRCMGVDETLSHRAEIGNCQVLGFDPAWTAGGSTPADVAYVAKRCHGAVRSVYAPVKRRPHDDIDAYDMGAAWHAMVTAVLVADCHERAATPYARFETAVAIAGGRSGFHAAGLANVDFIGVTFTKGTSFCASVFTRCRFFRCTFERCLYIGARFVDCTFVDCTVGGVPDAVLGGPHGHVTGDVSVVARAMARYGASFATLF